MLPGGMRDHTDCKYWKYDSHPDRHTLLPSRCRQLIDTALLNCRPLSVSPFDTRPDHAFMFDGMTPVNCTCILGNYRGTRSCPDLVNCRVQVLDDPNVGLEAEFVHNAMVDFEAQGDRVMTAYLRWSGGEGQSEPLVQKVKKFGVVAAYIFERFLTIHPYIDGNGHCARLLLCKLMAWAGFPAREWDIDQKFQIYQDIRLHRAGQRGPLIQKLTTHILSVM